MDKMRRRGRHLVQYFCLWFVPAGRPARGGNRKMTYLWNLSYFISFQLNLEPVTMEHKRFIWLDREHKWMELMDFHMSSNKSVKGLFIKMYTQN